MIHNPNHIKHIPRHISFPHTMKYTNMVFSKNKRLDMVANYKIHHIGFAALGNKG